MPEAPTGKSWFALDGALDRFAAVAAPAAQPLFRSAFQDLLLPLRAGNVAWLDHAPQGLTEVQTRLWGRVVDRILSFLRADGIIAIVQKDSRKESWCRFTS